MCAFEENVETIRKHCLKYNSLTEESILDIIKGKKTREDSVDGVLVYSVSGRPIKARSENQQKLSMPFK